MSRLDRALRRRSFRYLRWRRYREFRATVREDLEPVIVFQMGKVGSTSVHQTLIRHCPQFQMFQVHVLDWHWIRRQEQQFLEASRDHGRALIDEQALASRYLAGRLRRDPPPSGRWKVISMVRDPIARNVSAFFEAFNIYFSREAARADDPTMASLDVERLHTLFLDEFGETRHRVPLEWFGSHMEPVFGIDVYREAFDRDAGYQIYSGPTSDLLLLRTEDMRSCLNLALERFLGITLPPFESSNVSAEKQYAGAFDDFARHLPLPSAYLDRMYQSRYARHFYTAEELDGFRSRWMS